MVQYGYQDIKGDEEFPLASWVWGHRLRDGQDWIEYLLEFLNVLAGFEYQLGQGINTPPGTRSGRASYTIFKRMGLRRFAFYDDKEKTKHPLDDQARERLIHELRTRLEPQTDEVIDHLYSLLRSFSALERTRSWYAKSLFPAHHNLLMWESLRKGATRRRADAEAQADSPAAYDKDISFTQRNFFARGGEVYYLILSAGTERHPERRDFIERRLRTLLTVSYETLGKLASVIEESWQAVTGESPTKGDGKLGWILDPACNLYERFAEDVEMLLRKELDALELLYLLSSLICFHITVYVYVRAHPRATSAVLNNGVGLDLCRPTLPVDNLQGADGGVLRKVSATQFKLQEYRIEQKAKQYIHERVKGWAEEPTSTPLHRHLDSRVTQHFNLGAKMKSALEKSVTPLQQRYQEGDLSSEDFLNGYAEGLYEALAQDFRSHFLPIHRALAKAIGFVSPKTGTNARFTLSDDLLKALTLANVDTGRPLTFDQFLERLYDRYGLVVGPEAAHASGLYDRQPINVEYYLQNQAAFLDKLKASGFAVEYSDATAMVTASHHKDGR